MKIKSIETFVLSDKLDKPFYFSQWSYSERKICLVKLTTECGIVGWGEGYGPADVLSAGVKLLSQYVMGMNPLENETIWDTMYRRSLDYARRGVLVASISAIDMAVWDAKGKALNVPVHQLLGGKKRDIITPYATGLYFREEKDLTQALADEAVMYKDLGYHAVKMKVGMTLEKDIEMVHAVRKAIGDDMKLMVDSNHAYNLREAIILSKAIEEYNIGWFEEPVSPEYYDQYAELRQNTTIPIAGGECENLRYGFHQLFKNNSVDIAQPDIAACGGLTEVKKIAALASAYGKEIVPHSWGTYIAISAAMHFISNLENIPGRMFNSNFYMEHDRTDNDLRDKVTIPDFEVKNGELIVSDKPGLGVEVDEAALAKFCL
ncbi:mandelate racemase/muconate lactonizing enzyme family protein [Saccharicrinis aurantiacus]|uniref:mandelate racemase/muconate lactonizing enzyme family protein n=1 Tax=Saccharicrinis aurantiacus TaxID=1849719 RepID=UPI0024919B60|nr:mandelate racemase/muconate lactonizing enzyme family protein [Saccharicrinis aurantiacus]